MCLHEEDHGILFKHTDYRNGRAHTVRGRRLVISQIVTGKLGRKGRKRKNLDSWILSSTRMSAFKSLIILVSFLQLPITTTVSTTTSTKMVPLNTKSRLPVNWTLMFLLKTNPPKVMVLPSLLKSTPNTINTSSLCVSTLWLTAPTTLWVK